MKLLIVLIAALLAALYLSATALPEPQVGASPLGSSAEDALARATDEIILMTQWRCTSPVNLDLVRVTLSSGSTDAVQLRAGCTGVIRKLEVSGTMADCIKVNPPGGGPQNLVIESGFCHVTGPPASGVHQDCIQAGGGANVTFINFAWDCVGGGGGNYFIAGFNGGQPRNFLAIHNAFGPRHPNQIRTPSDPGSGVKDSLVCLSSSGRTTYSPASGNKGGNFSPAANDPQCSWEGLLAYVGGSDPNPPPPPPPPPPTPVLTNCQDFVATFFACWPQLANVVRFNFYIDGVLVSHSLNGNLTRVRFGKLQGTHLYGVGAVNAAGEEGYAELSVTR